MRECLFYISKAEYEFQIFSTTKGQAVVKWRREAGYYEDDDLTKPIRCSEMQPSRVRVIDEFGKWKLLW